MSACHVSSIERRRLQSPRTLQKGWRLSRNPITGHRIKQIDLTRINRKSRRFAQPGLEIRRHPAERSLIANAQYNDGLRSCRLDHFHRSRYGKDRTRRVAKMSCRLGDAFGPNAEHDLAAEPAFGRCWHRKAHRRLTAADDGHGPTGSRLQAG